MKRALSTAWTFSMANATSDKQCLFLTYPEIKKSKVLIVMFVTLSIWNGILLLFALVANALVCTAILKSKELRIRTSNTLLPKWLFRQLHNTARVPRPTPVGAARSLHLLGDRNLQSSLASLNRNIFPCNLLYRLREIYHLVLHFQLQANYHHSTFVTIHRVFGRLVGCVCLFTFPWPQHTALLRSCHIFYHHSRQHYHAYLRSHL